MDVELWCDWENHENLKYVKNVYCVRQSQQRSGHASKPQNRNLINILACRLIVACLIGFFVAAE